MIAYLDASVAVSVMQDDEDGHTVRAFLDGLDPDLNTLLSGRLLETEMRRTAHRLKLTQGVVDAALATITIVEHEKSDFGRAGLFDISNLGSLDALHLATALRVQADVMITRDRSLAAACVDQGLPLLDVN
jgi:predicted nucleic acid-binding protein